MEWDGMGWRQGPGTGKREVIGTIGTNGVKENYFPTFSWCLDQQFGTQPECRHEINILI